MPQLMEVTRRALVNRARELKSENGSNPEYDRALVELITLACGGDTRDLSRTTTDIFDKARPELWFSTNIVPTETEQLAWYTAEDALGTIAHVQVDAKHPPEVEVISSGVYRVGAWTTVTDAQLKQTKQWRQNLKQAHGMLGTTIQSVFD